MDVIGHLTRTVSPAVLGDDSSPAKKGLLEQFYAIFAARLADNDVYGRFTNENIATDDQSFYDRVWTDGSQRGQISSQLAEEHAVDPTAARGLVAMAAPLAYHEIKSLAGTTPVPQFLNDNLSSYQKHIPLWASAVVPAGVVAASTPAGATLSDTVSTAPLQRQEEEKGSFMKALLPIIGLIILGALAWALLRGCQENPEPVGSPVNSGQVIIDDTASDDAGQTGVAMDVEPASLRIATGSDANSLYACRINVGDDTLQSTVMNAMANVFGDESNKCRADVDDSFAIDMPASAQLGSMLQIIKSVPNASMLIKGNDIVVNAADADVLQQLVTDLQAAAPAMTVTAEGPLDLQNEIDTSMSAAQMAVDNLGDNPSPRDVARALSLQVVHFEVDEAIIPEANKALLDNAVKIMQQVPDMTLMIIGHTDKTADAAYNMTLSQQRAQAMKDYLVAQGADPSKLMTKGMGETDPIADNATEQGRFRNRRIEFTVYDETTMGEGSGIAVMPDTIGVTNANTADPDLNPLDPDNDDILPDSDDPTQGTVLDPKAK